MGKFMDTRLAKTMGFSVECQELVLLAKESILPTSELTNPKELRVGDLDFNLHFPP